MLSRFITALTDARNWRLSEANIVLPYISSNLRQEAFLFREGQYSREFHSLDRIILERYARIPLAGGTYHDYCRTRWMSRQPLIEIKLTQASAHIEICHIFSSINSEALYTTEQIISIESVCLRFCQGITKPVFSKLGFLIDRIPIDQINELLKEIRQIIIPYTTSTQNCSTPHQSDEVQTFYDPDRESFRLLVGFCKWLKGMEYKDSSIGALARYVRYDIRKPLWFGDGDGNDKMNRYIGLLESSSALRILRRALELYRQDCALMERLGIYPEEIEEDG